ncbi:helix-turn-helix domain-containing protein [Pseudomonadota bacterium]
MKTLGLIEAASFLKMHPEELRRRTKRGIIPGAKAGRAWVFIDEDLAGWLRSQYMRSVQVLQLKKEVGLCRSTSANQPGGSISSLQQESEYADLLGLTRNP